MEMSRISKLLKTGSSGRNDPNFLKSFEQLTDEALAAIRGHKNQKITIFTFKRN